MKNPPRFLPLLSALILSALTMVGCRSVPVEILAVSAPDSLLTNQSGTFSVTTNEKAKKPVAYSWDFKDSGTSASNPATHAFANPGRYDVNITVSNRKGKTRDTETTPVVVYNPPVPAQLVSFSADPMNPDTRTNVRFMSNANGDMPIMYSWNFGDGGNASTASPTHTFATPGTYTVSLDVSNKAGADSRSMTITVRPYEAAICREITSMNAAFFDRNSSVLTPDGRASLQENLEILRECPNLNGRLEGYAAPGERNPQRLSEDRARAVEQFYVEGGVAANRLATQGKGRVMGVTSKKEGTSQYRRVDTIPLR